MVVGTSIWRVSVLGPTHLQIQNALPSPRYFSSIARNQTSRLKLNPSTTMVTGLNGAFGYDCASKPRQLIQGTAPANGRTGICGRPSCGPPSNLPQKRRHWASGVLEPCIILIFDALGNTFCGAHVRPKYSSPFSKFLEKVRDHVIDNPPVFGLHSPASGAKYG